MRAKIEEITTGCFSEKIGCNFCGQCQFEDCRADEPGFVVTTRKACSHEGVCVDGRHEGGCGDCWVWAEG